MLLLLLVMIMEMKLNELVSLAKSGDEKATKTLLRKYGWREKGPYKLFLGKYFNMLWYGKLDLKNKDCRKFIRLYINDPHTKYKLKFYNMDYISSLKSQTTMNFIQEKVRERYTREELKADLTLTFLELVKRYQKINKIDFSGYLMGMYKFAVYGLLQKQVFNYDILNNENKIYDYEFPIEELGYKKINNDDIKYINELDIFWINGETGPIFKDTTKLERIILRDWYILGKTDTEIAKDNGFHRNSILNKRHTIVNIIKSQIKRELN